MCGIVGYIGNNEAIPFLIDGLKKLEYRGYDSAGIAVNSKEGVVVLKSVGRIENLVDKISDKSIKGCVGIGHSRWATHGRPSDENAHPHTDCTGKIAIIHNGIIENYMEIKKMLENEGHVFKSDTDTEVVAHLLEKFYDKDLKSAVYKLLKLIKGSYSIVFIVEDEPDRIVAVRKHSPMIIGYGEGENYLASDIPALLGYTKKVTIMEDGDVVELTADEVNVYDSNGNKIERNVMEVSWSSEAAEKGGYEHFMLKEIHEQSEAVKRTLIGRIVEKNGLLSVNLKDVNFTDDYLKSINKVVIVACGTASYAGQVGKFVLEKFARIPTDVELASEFRYRDPIIDEKTLVVVISQSGETADTLAGLKEAQSRGAKVLSITNVVDSSVARESDFVLYTLAGPEIAVASTKAYITQLEAIYLAAIDIAQRLGKLDSKNASELLAGIKELPQQIERIFSEKEDMIKELSVKLSESNDIFFMGRGMDYATSLEGALKLKEISYIHSEAYAAGELKHGSIALITDGTPVITVLTQKALKEKTLSNVLEVKARGAFVIAVGFESDEEIVSTADVFIALPHIDPVLAPMLSIIPLQLLAYYVALNRGTDVDKPRNLAKSVTVE